MTGYLPRLLDVELAEVLASHPAVLVVGPRACGKTTTTHRHCRSVLRLDVPAQAGAVRADPDVALRHLDEPVLIDEWQVVPEVLGAVKRAVDADPRPGRFLLTGSSQADLTVAGWPAAGRIVRLEMYPMTGRERHGDAAAPSLVDRIISQADAAFGSVRSGWDLSHYVAEALSSGWPEPMRLASQRGRDRWLTGYVDHLVTREAPSLGVARVPALMRRYLYAIAANTAGTPTHKLLYDAAGINRDTAAGYDDLFEALMITDRVPAWSGNRMDRAVRLPKRYLVDPGLGAAVLRVDERRVLRDADLLGRLLDTYVAAQLRVECAMSVVGADLFHLRDANGRREIDLLIETRDGRVIAVEVKATASPSRSDARHLEWAAQRWGEAFALGLVVHTGPAIIRFADRILAIPIAALWSGSS
ncbi:MAG: ATP-binding protein [Kineosporiaceae bacterium]|nr:ATP-binding protein [Kineosporiaceae bacterium]